MFIHEKNLINFSFFSESKNNNESRRMVDITRDKPIKVAVRVVVPVRDHPKVSLPFLFWYCTTILCNLLIL